MKIERLDLDGLGSPTAIAAKIHDLLPDIPDEVPIEQLCCQLDIDSIKEVETSAFEAALVMDGLKAAGAILLAGGRSRARQRFSLGHELGHFLIPTHISRAGQSFECSLADLHSLDPKDRDRRRRIEAEANRFAARLLMPPRRVRARLNRHRSSLEGIVAMSREFGVSKEAMARCWVDAHREPVAVIVAQNGRVLRRYRNDDFPWLPTENGQRLPHGSIASPAAPAPGVYSPIEEIDPDVWLTERDAKRTLSLSEQALGQRDGYALILLQAELDED